MKIKIKEKPTCLNTASPISRARYCMEGMLVPTHRSVIHWHNRVDESTFSEPSAFDTRYHYLGKGGQRICGPDLYVLEDGAWDGEHGSD